jgi:hypothetical protein
LPACCCQPVVAGGIIYADLWGKLNTHLALQALFTQSSPVHEPLLQAFPFPSTLGEVTLHLLFLACVFIYSSHGKWVFPSFLWSFPPSTPLTSFPTPGCWAHAPTPTGASPARPSLFIYNSRNNSPPLLFGAQGTPPSLQCVFIVLIAYYSGFFFPRGLCCSGPGLSVGLPCTAKLNLSMSSQTIWAQATGSLGPSWILCLT